jgi:predicted nuclease with TOPRIM domain
MAMKALLILVVGSFISFSYALVKPVGKKAKTECYAMQEKLQRVQKNKKDEEAKTIQAEQVTERFTKFVPKEKANLASIEKKFPVFFVGIPKDLHQKLYDYIEMQFGEKIIPELEKLSKEGDEAVRVFKWIALGTFAGLAPFEGSGYVFFTLPGKSMKHLYVWLPNYAELNQEYKELYKEYETLKDELKQLKNQRAILKRKPAKENQKKLAQLKIQENQKNEKIKQFEKNLTELYQKKQELIKLLTGNYKIHLMPADGVSSTEVLLMILNALADDPELRNLVPSFKLHISFKNISGDKVMPKIVFYIANGQDKAQKALNKLYALFNDKIKGLGLQPRYNAKVTDLIWFAQGDGDFKGDECAKYYEAPGRTYYRANITGEKMNYHLTHPGTGKEII